MFKKGKIKKDSEERDEKKKIIKDPGEEKGKERMLKGRKERARKFINTCPR